jgi:prophage antirepressor-like protein
MRRGLPDPERFQDWVTDEMLSQIRQTGGFVAPQHYF